MIWTVRRWIADRLLSMSERVRGGVVYRIPPGEFIVGERGVTLQPHDRVEGARARAR